MKILFLHGWQSVVGGVKPSSLRKAGHEVINPALDHDDFAAAVRTAQAAFARHRPDVIVGSSRGGAVAMNLAAGVTPRVLLCPAWKRWGAARALPAQTVILHSRVDEVIPFADSEELVADAECPESILVEIGNDHRLADRESLTMMLRCCEQHAPKLVGCDVGAPRRAGDQAKKNVLIEATQLGSRHYAIRPWGRNARLLRSPATAAGWRVRRRGWTVPELAASLGPDPTLRVGGMDFPFGIPQALLGSQEFAEAVGRPAPFANRQAWARFIRSRLQLAFASDRASGAMIGLDRFDAWRKDSRFWLPRGSDRAANGQPPLKHIGQNLFAMTIAGARLLGALQEAGVDVVLDRFPKSTGRVAFETYPSLVAKRIGFRGSYKQQPVACLHAACGYLKACGVRLDFDRDVQHFCETYRTGAKRDDPDGADAFLCLVAAICFQQGNRELIQGDATPAELQNEGGIVVPQSSSNLGTGPRLKSS